MFRCGSLLAIDYCIIRLIAGGLHGGRLPGEIVLARRVIAVVTCVKGVLPTNKARRTPLRWGLLQRGRSFLPAVVRMTQKGATIKPSDYPYTPGRWGCQGTDAYVDFFRQVVLMAPALHPHEIVQIRLLRIPDGKERVRNYPPPSRQHQQAVERDTGAILNDRLRFRGG